MPRLTFIVGGARSGKSDYAVRAAEAASGKVLFIATAQAVDDEMRSRIAAHQRRRPAAWELLEMPMGIGQHLLAHPPGADVVLLDCLTLLISNTLLDAAPDADRPDADAVHAVVEHEVQAVLSAIDESRSHWLVVSNEVGQGVVPAYPLGRLFRDILGRANKQFAEAADEVIWMIAGIPVPIGQHRRGRQS